MKKLYSDANAALEGLLRDGITIAAGGFGLCGLPDRLLDAIRDRLDAMIPADHGVLPSRVRHDQLLGTAAGHLRQAAAMSEADVVAEELRLAAEALGRVTGTIDTEEVLGAIFSEFCVGK